MATTSKLAKGIVFQKYSPSEARSGPTPPPLTITVLVRAPIGAIALETPVKAESTKGTLLTLTSLLAAITPCAGNAWLSS